MRKKKIIGSVAVILSFILAGCTQSADRTSAKQTNVACKTSSESEENGSLYGYEINCSSYRDGNTVLFYPELKGMNDVEKEKRLNELIFESAKKVIDFFSSDTVCITVDFETEMSGKDRLIINYTGYGYTSDESGEGLTVYYTSDVDMKNEKIYDE